MQAYRRLLSVKAELAEIQGADARLGPGLEMGRACWVRGDGKGAVAIWPIFKNQPTSLTDRALLLWIQA